MKIKIAFLLLSILGHSMSSFSQSSKSLLPTPDSTFFTNPKPLAENIIEKYIKSYFDITKPNRKIGECGDSGSIWRTEFSDIAIEACIVEIESLDYYERNDQFVFKNYSMDEVNRILRLLFVDDEYDKWEGNNYGPFEGGAGCFVEIIKEKDKIIVTYGCSC